jgi:hypothetical protein
MHSEKSQVRSLGRPGATLIVMGTGGLASRKDVGRELGTVHTSLFLVINYLLQKKPLTTNFQNAKKGISRKLRRIVYLLQKQNHLARFGQTLKHKRNRYGWQFY